MSNTGLKYLCFGVYNTFLDTILIRKMHRNLMVKVAIVLLIIVVWIYWSSKVEFNNAVIDLGRYTYFDKNILLAPSSNTCSQRPFIVIIVTSYVGHVELRSSHRRAMPPGLLKTMNSTRVFLLAKIPPKEKYITQEAIKDESNTFGDILQGSFIENYRNLTHKHLMGLRWASTACIEASFILKVDDDTVFNLESTFKLLSKLNNIDKDNFLMGYMLNNTIPRRNKQNKWYVTWEEYQKNEYPPYLSGWYYITTPKVAAKLTGEAEYHPYFWIDDIYITGLLVEALKIKLRHLPKDYWLEYYELLECCLRDMIHKYIRCDHVVGPNGGRNNLIFEFNDAVRHCDKLRNCTTRSDRETLNKVCVAFKERDIFSDGQAEVNSI